MVMSRLCTIFDVVLIVLKVQYGEVLYVCSYINWWNKNSLL